MSDFSPGDTTCKVALACMNVSFQANQAPNYHEIIGTFQSPAFPFAVQTFYIVFHLRDGRPGTWSTKVRLSGPPPIGKEIPDQRLADIAFTTEILDARIHIALNQFVFPTPGRYHFELLVSDKVVGSTHIDVKQGGPNEQFVRLPSSIGGS